MYQIWLKSIDFYSSYRPETKKWCLGQITPSKFDKICPLAIPIQISTISMHIPSLVKIHWCLLKLSSGNENMGVSRADNSVKFDEICPLAIPHQIPTISMHIPFLVKIHWCLLKLSSRNEKRMDGHMDVQHETIIPRHYIVAGYKLWWYQCTVPHTKLGENPLKFFQVIVQKWKYWWMSQCTTSSWTERLLHGDPMWNHTIVW